MFRALGEIDMRQIAPTIARVLHVNLKDAELGPLPLNQALISVMDEVSMPCAADSARVLAWSNCGTYASEELTFSVGRRLKTALFRNRTQKWPSNPRAAN